MHLIVIENEVPSFKIQIQYRIKQYMVTWKGYLVLMCKRKIRCFDTGNNWQQHKNGSMVGPTYHHMQRNRTKQQSTYIQKHTVASVIDKQQQWK